MVVAAASLLATFAIAPAAFADKRPANHDQAQNEDAGDASQAKKGKHSKHDNNGRRGNHKQSVQSDDQQHQKNRKGGENSASQKNEKKNVAPQVGNRPSNSYWQHNQRPANANKLQQAPTKNDAAKAPPPNTFSKTQPNNAPNSYGKPGSPDHRRRTGNDRHNGHEKPNRPAQATPPPPNGAPNAGFAKSDRRNSRKRQSADDARKQFEKLRSSRKERVEGGSKVIEEPGRRMYKVNNRLVIQHDERERLRKVAPHAQFKKEANGVTVSVVNRPGNVKIYSELDQHGQLIRRYRRGPNGHDTIIIDNRRRHHHRHGGHGKDVATGIGIGLGVAAGAAILNAIVDVPEPHVRIPRDQYIVEYDGASEEDVYDALSAPPVGDYSDRYTLDEIRATSQLRDRMRRVDLDDINFEFGSWEVDPDQYHTLERIARAMKRVIRHNPNEVFLIEGYTDAVGSDEDNLSLSDRRAESVAEVLTEEFDVPFENLVTQGYGEQYLKVDTDGPERLNRRVAVRRITPLLARDE
jgi:outer membrane protein OmpA-like peptidoglycan-associated protein